MSGEAAERLRVALAMADDGFELMRQNLRRSDPAAGDGEIDARLVAWIASRPGAPLGDCPGVPRRLAVG